MECSFTLFPGFCELGQQLNIRLSVLAARAVCYFSASGIQNQDAAADRAQINQKAAYLLDTYGNSILRCAYSYLHNMADSEEVLQDTLIQYLKTVPALDGPRHEKAWLLRVAANLSKNRLAYNAVRKTDELRDDLIAEHREDLSFVWDAVKELPEQYRIVIHLYHHEGCSTGEIAGILGKKESTVRSDLRRGRARLKEILKGAYDLE